ncbi:MAG: PD-(D/E)XK nuclease family protein [Elusimicrobia bacterium]|nr:PD-(D/E)XK nuclease family protein [Elusimicrobiota bacterium]
MKVDIIGPKENLVEKAGEILLSAKSLADNVVVFPGKRPAHFLRKFLAEKKGSALKAPVIASMDGFIDLVAEELGFDAPAAPQLDLAWLLYDGSKTGLCRVIAADPKALALDSILPWALKIIGDFEELKIELKTQKDLSAYDSLLPEDLKPDSFIKKLESFSRLYGEFYAAVEKEGLLTRAMKYAEAAGKISQFNHKRYENIIFAGFFALTNAEKIILKHLSNYNAQVLLESGPGLEEQFQFLELSSPVTSHRSQVTSNQSPVTSNRSPVTSHKPETALHFYKASDTHGEIFKLAELFNSHSSTLKPSDPKTLNPFGSRDVIVLPEARALFPLIENVLPKVENYNISMGYPLVSTPVYALIDALADLLDKKGEAGYFAPNYLNFVFHPYVKNIYFKADSGECRVDSKRSAEPSRIIFQTIEEHVSSRVNKYITLKEIENDAELLRTAADKLNNCGEKIGPADIKAHIAALHKTLIVPFEKIKDIGGFAAKLLDFISYISENSTAPLHPYWAPFVERAIEHIIELRNSRLAGIGFAGAGGYFKFFKTFIRDAAYPFPGAPLKGLQVLGSLETRGLKFDRVYFLDANADILPAPRKEDTLLPHFVREGLGLSTYKTRERRSRYYFTTLLAGAREAHIFYKDSADKERSPFVERLVWDLERQGKEPDESDAHFRIKFAQGPPAPAGKPEELIAELACREFSPSAIDTYLNCGLQFYYKYALGLKEKDELSGDIEQRDIGVMVHEILENFFKPRIGRPLEIKKEDYALMFEEAGRTFDARMKNHGSGFEYLIKRQIEKRLSDILDHHRAKLAGVTVLAVETELKAEISTRYGGIKLKGRADRIDLRGAVTHILDYKTGAAAGAPNWSRFDLGLRADWPGTLKSVQLPFYLLAYLEEKKGAGIRNMDASLMLLGREEIQEETLFRERYKKVPDKAVFSGVYRQAITVLIEEILDPALAFTAAPDETPCAACPFKTLCGRQWVE